MVGYIIQYALMSNAGDKLKKGSWLLYGACVNLQDKEPLNGVTTGVYIGALGT